MTDRLISTQVDPWVPAQRSRVRTPQQPAGLDPRRARRRALLVPLTLGTVGICAATAVGIGVLTAQSVRSTHAFALTGSVVGMDRDPAAETAYADQVAGVESAFRAQFTGRLSQFVTAVYDNPTARPARPAGSVVFLGAAIDTRGDPADFVASFSAGARATGARVTAIDVGAGALGVCSQSPASPAVTSCAWSTGDSVGELVPTVDGWSSARLGARMARFRAALETDDH